MPTPLRVLILEDSPTDAEVMAQHLRAAGYAPEWRRVETEADYLASLEPTLDLILADYTLPAFTARQALQPVRERGWDVPVIIVTGTVSEAIALECLRLGASDYLLKDRLGRLGPAVRQALAQRALRAERRLAETALAARTRQLEALRIISEEITRELTLTTLLDLIIRRAVELVEVKAGAIYLWDDATQTLGAAAWTGLGEWMRDIRYRLGDHVVGTVAQRRQSLIVNDYQNWAGLDPRLLEHTRITAALGEPLLYRDRLVGVITMNTERIERAFTQQDREGLALFAAQAAIAIENARLYEASLQHARELETRVQERTHELAEANQKLEAASSHKSEFLASMSHELRTPLNSILGFAQLLLEQTREILSTKQNRYLTHVRDSGQHLLQLINDILDISKVEAGKFELHPELFPVSEILEDILVIARGLAHKKAQSVILAVEPDLPHLSADPVRFKQILFNLLSNAVKFTPEGGTIRIEAHRVPLPHEAVEIRIIDSGIGIRADDLPRLFQEFVQLGSTQAQRHEGTGLGLALSRRLVELHGGCILVASEGEGKGSTFAIRLPLRPNPPPIEVEPPCSRDHTPRGSEQDLAESKNRPEREGILNGAPCVPLPAPLHSLMAQLPLAMMTLDSGDRVGTWNAAAERLFGWTATDVIGRALPMIPADQQQRFQTLLSADRAGAHQDGLEIRCRRKDGTLVDVSLWTVPLRDATGTIDATIAFFADMSLHTQAESSLEKRRSQLQAVRAASVDITRELELPRLLHVITSRAVELVGGDSGTLFLWNADAQVLTAAAWPGLGAWRAAHSYGLGQGVVGTVAAEREGLLVNEYPASPYARPEVLEHVKMSAVLAEPLLYRDVLVGVLGVEKHRAGAAFSGLDQEMLRLFASQAAIAIENARLYQSANARADELAILRHIDETMTSQLKLPAVLDAIVTGVMRLLGNPFGQLVLWDAENQQLVFGAAQGPEAERVREQRFAMGRGITGRVAETREPMILNAYQDSPYAVPECTDVVATITVPLLFGDRLLGVLHSHTTQAGREFSADDLRRLRLLASHAAFAIDNARSHEAALHRSTELEALLNATRSVMSDLDLPTILERIATEAARSSGSPHIKVLLVDAETQTLQLGVLSGRAHADGFPLPIGCGLSGLVAETGTPLFVSDTQTDPRSLLAAQDAALGIRTYLGLPIKYQDRVLGVLTINTMTPRGEYTPEEMVYFRAFADQAAFAIENARLHEAAVRRGVEMEGLLRAVRSLLSGGDLRTVLDRIATEAAARAGTAYVKVLLVDQAAQEIRIGALKGGTACGYPIPLGRGLSGLVARTGEIVFSADCPNDPRNFFAAEDRAAGVMTYLGIPIKAREVVVGVLTFTTMEPQRYTPRELAYLSAFADYAALAIENARHFEGMRSALAERTQTEKALRERTRQLETLRAVGEEITRELDLARVLDLITQRAVTLVGASSGILRLWDGERELLLTGAWIGAATQVPTASLRLGEGVSGEAARRREALYVNDFRTSPYAIPVLLHGSVHTAVMAVPLLYRERLVGVLAITRNATDPAFIEADLEALRLFAPQAAIAIENARLHQAAEQELQHRKEAETQLRQIVRAVEQSPASVVITDTLGAIEYVNPKFSAVTGYTLDEVRGQNPRVLKSGEMSSSQYAELWQTITAGKEWRGELHNRRKDGSMFWEMASISPVRDEGGRITHFVAVKEDITAWKAADAALATRTRQLEALRSVSEEITRELDLPTVLDLIVHRTLALVQATSGSIRLWDQGQRMLIPATSTGSGMHAAAVPLRLGEGVVGTAAARRRGLIVNDFRTSEYGIPSLLEGTTHTAVMATPLLYGERLVGVLVISRDGTDPPFVEADLQALNLFAPQAAIAVENARLHAAVQHHAADLEQRIRERTADLQEALRVKTEFLTRMSHELRTPLNAVLGFSTLLRDGSGLPPKQAKYVEHVHAGGRHLLALVGDLLTLSETEGGQAPLRLEEQDLASIVHEAVTVHDASAARKKLAITMEIASGLRCVADGQRLLQILSHLVGNAVKFTPDGGQVRIAARHVPPEELGGGPAAGETEILVADTGIGLAATDLNRIFVGFEQVDGSGTRKYGGAGIGLALVRRLVELHGGRVWAESPGPEQGSRFLVRLPLVEVLRCKRILVAEDNLVLQKPLATLLRDAKYTVEVTASVRDAKRLLAADPPDLLILDLDLPDGDARDLLRCQQAGHPDLPVIVLSDLDASDADALLRLGAQEVLRKSVAPGALADVVRAFFNMQDVAESAHREAAR